MAVPKLGTLKDVFFNISYIEKCHFAVLIRRRQQRKTFQVRISISSAL